MAEIDNPSWARRLQGPNSHDGASCNTVARRNEWVGKESYAFQPKTTVAGPADVQHLELAYCFLFCLNQKLFLPTCPWLPKNSSLGMVV